jgi:hypothetical protein
VPLAAIVLCFAANCSTYDGVNRMYLMKDFVAVFFRVFNLMFSCQRWTTLGFVAKQPCGGWLDDALSSNLPNFVFQVSSKIDIGPVLPSWQYNQWNHMFMAFNALGRICW